MTKEQEEAIKELNKLVRLRKNKTTGKIKFDTCICATRDLEAVLNLLEKKDRKIDILINEREYIKNNLEVDLKRKGIYSQAKGQISQILEYYKNNDKYFERKVEENK